MTDVIQEQEQAEKAIPDEETDAVSEETEESEEETDEAVA